MFEFCDLTIPALGGVGVEANALSEPPGEYERKLKTQRNRRGPAQAVEHVVQFDTNRRTLPRFDIYLYGLPETGGFQQWTDRQVLHGCRQLVS